MTGIICMWHGLIANIPDGWRLCNGTYGTPDLRDRFVVGAGLGIQPGGTGGANVHEHTGVVQNDTHNHVGSSSLEGVQVDDDTSEEVISLDSGTDIHDAEGDGEYAEDGTGHSHELYFETDDHQHDVTVDNDTHNHNLVVNPTVTLPPYYKILFIMKT